MRTYTRRQLKQDQFAEATAETLSWANLHRNKLIVGGIVVAAVLAIGLAWWQYRQGQAARASVALSQAMTTYNAPLRPAGAPASSEVLSFTSSVERARVAHNEFQKVAAAYPHVQPGRVAGYFAALTASQMGDAAAGENELKQVAASGDADLAALAKMALAAQYRDTNRKSDAIRLYQEVIEHPTDTVSGSMARLELADLYAANNQTADANKLYEQIQKDDPTSPAAELASTRLKDLK